MSRRTVINVLNKQFPEFPYAFWEQVLKTIERLQRSEVSLENDLNDADRFATPPMEAFAISPVTPAFEPVVVTNGGDENLATTLQRYAISPGCLLAPNGRESLVGKHVAQLCHKVPSSPPCPDDQCVTACEIHTWSRPHQFTNLEVATDVHMPRPYSNNVVSSVCVLADEPSRQENDTQDDIEIEVVTRTHALSYADDDVETAHILATDEEDVIEQDLQVSDENAPDGVDHPRSLSPGVVVNGGDAFKSGPDEELDEAGRVGTETSRSCSSANKKRSAHAVIRSQRQAKVPKIRHANHISSAEIEAGFKAVKADVEDVALVSGLLNNIGGPETINELKHACSAARTPGSYVTSDTDIACSVKAICELEDEQKRMPMLYRYHWLRVVQWRDRKIDEYLSQGRARRTATTLALTHLMKLMHPRLKETDHKYRQRYQDLIQRTSHARHWLELQERFSIGILAIIPSADFLGCPPFKIEKMKNRTFQVLLDLLLKYRGDFLRALSQRLSSIYDILLLKRSTIQYKFESTSDVQSVPRDSDQLLDLCTETE